ncbi:MAG: hypothetical protein AB1716_19505 [Planctomycetota bacterium]
MLATSTPTSAALLALLAQQADAARSLWPALHEVGLRWLYWVVLSAALLLIAARHPRLAPWLARLRNVDSRWLYLGMLVVLIVPLGLKLPVPLAKVSAPTRGVFDALDNCPPDKVILIDSSWTPGSAPENQAEFEAVLRHACRRQIKIVITSIAVDAFAPLFAERAAEPIMREFGYVYGRDWVNLGYVPGPPTATRGMYGALIERMCNDMHAMFPRDYRGNKLADLPLMARVRSHADIYSFGCITYQANEDWISVIHGRFGGRFWAGCMSVVGPFFHQYLDSRQMVGALIGNRGAAEYELLLQQKGLFEGHGRGTRMTIAGSFGNCAVIVAALLGNLGLLAARQWRTAA